MIGVIAYLVSAVVALFWVRRFMLIGGMTRLITKAAYFEPTERQKVAAIRTSWVAALFGPLTLFCLVILIAMAIGDKYIEALFNWMSADDHE